MTLVVIGSAIGLLLGAGAGKLLSVRALACRRLTR